MSTCTWGTWHVDTHVEETHGARKKQGRKRSNTRPSRTRIVHPKIFLGPEIFLGPKKWNYYVLKLVLGWLWSKDQLWFPCPYPYWLDWTQTGPDLTHYSDWVRGSGWTIRVREGRVLDHLFQDLVFQKILFLGTLFIWYLKWTINRMKIRVRIEVLC